MSEDQIARALPRARAHDAETPSVDKALRPRRDRADVHRPPPPCAARERITALEHPRGADPRGHLPSLAGRGEEGDRERVAVERLAWERQDRQRHIVFVSQRSPEDLPEDLVKAHEADRASIAKLRGELLSPPVAQAHSLLDAERRRAQVLDLVLTLRIGESQREVPVEIPPAPAQREGHAAPERVGDHVVCGLRKQLVDQRSQAQRALRDPGLEVHPKSVDQSREGEKASRVLLTALRSGDSSMTHGEERAGAPMPLSNIILWAVLAALMLATVRGRIG